MVRSYARRSSYLMPNIGLLGRNGWEHSATKSAGGEGGDYAACEAWGADVYGGRVVSRDPRRERSRPMDRRKWSGQAEEREVQRN